MFCPNTNDPLDGLTALLKMKKKKNSMYRRAVLYQCPGASGY